MKFLSKFNPVCFSLITILIVLMHSCVASAQCRADTTYQYSWESAVTVKTLGSIIVYSYNQVGDISSYSNYLANGGAFDLFDTYTYSYNSNSELDTITKTRWNKNTNTNDRLNKQFYSYVDGLVKTLTTQTWPVSGGTAWQNLNQYTYEYNSLDQETTNTHKWWNDVMGKWVNSGRYSSSYNNDNLLEEYVFESWDASNNQWMVVFKTETTYNNNQQIIEKRHYTSNGGTLTNDVIWDLTYDASDLLVKELRRISISSSAFDTASHILYSYDANDSLTEALQQNWLGPNDWVNFKKETYEYAPSGFLSAYDNYVAWNIALDDFNTHTRNEYTCVPFSSVEEIHDEDLFKVYPNPNNLGLCYIESKEQTKYSIYTSKGELVVAGSLIIGVNQISLPETLVNGLYFVKVHGLTQKLTVLR